MNNSEEHRRACEAREVLKMSEDKRQEYYEGVKKHRGQRGVDYLAEEVTRQEAGQVLKMEYEERQAYYQGVKDKRGEKAVKELITEVKRQRRLMKENAMEM